MFDDGRPFLLRAWVFFEEMQKDHYPNTASIAERTNCSTKTVQRMIDSLRYEFKFPIKYDDVRRGWFLENKAFAFPDLPPTRDEWTAFLLSKSLATVLGDKDFQRDIHSLWSKYARKFPEVSIPLEDLGVCFSSEITAVGKTTEYGVVDFLNFAAGKHGCELHYKSPWKEGDEKIFRGRILRVHFCDGIIYLLFGCEDGKQLVLNGSFVKGLNRLAYDPLEHVALKDDGHEWLHGFGVWSGDKLQDVEIHILPPASRYFALQDWDETQEDTWDGEVLIRRLKAQISPEIVRRILSLGSFVKEIYPPELKDAVRKEVKSLAAQLE